MTPDHGPSECAFEEPVLAALAARSLTGALLSHAECCLVCGETRSVWNHLNAISDAELEAPLISPHLIWWKAQLAEQRHLAERSVTIIQLVRKVALAAAVLALSVAGYWLVPYLPVTIPAVYLWAVLALIGLSLITAASFLYSERHTTRR